LVFERLAGATAWFSSRDTADWSELLHSSGEIRLNGGSQKASGNSCHRSTFFGRKKDGGRLVGVFDG
jgi:hypothetical protein